MASNRAGSGTIIALSSDQRYLIPYNVESGTPSRIRASFSAAPNNPPDRSLLSFVVTDQYGNPVPGQEFRVKVSGGEIERSEGRTGANGRITLEVVWDSETKGEAVITSGSLPSVTIVRKAAK